jgi:hypothetical protein
MTPKLSVTNEQIEAARAAFKQMTEAADRLHSLSTELGWNDIEDSKELSNAGADTFAIMFFSFIDSCDCPGDDILHVREFDKYLKGELFVRTAGDKQAP